MLNSLFGRFSHDLGIDLGTTRTRIFARERGIVIDEPSVVAINTRTNQILAVGRDAESMLGKTPPHVLTSQPLQQGLISDFEVTEKMLKFFVERIHKESFTLVPRPRVVISVPLEVTEVERKAVEDAVLHAGAREVHVVQTAMASGIGARLPVSESLGMMLVDIGGGTTEIAVLSLSGIVTWKSIPVAGKEMDRSIIQYAREVFNLMLGERVAEKIKMRIGSATELEEPLEMDMRGRDMITGLPKQITINDGQIREALERSVQTILNHVKATLELTPPELVADIYERGIVLTGGGALLRGMDRLLSRGTAIPVRVAEDPTTTVVRGTGFLLEDEDLLRDVSLPSAVESAFV